MISELEAIFGKPNGVCCSCRLNSVTFVFDYANGRPVGTCSFCQGGVDRAIKDFLRQKFGV